MPDITNLTVKTAHQLLLSKQVKAEELTKEFLERAVGLNDRLNSYITITAAEAIDSAKKVDKLIADGQPLSQLAGIPIAIKDVYLTRGIKTTAASYVLENYIPVYNATVVSKLREANAVFLGKTNLDAWAHGSSGENSDFGPTKNPYDQKRVPGGSSSGSA